MRARLKPTFNYLKVGDCHELIPTLKSGSIDLTVFSPPYDNLRTYSKAGYAFDRSLLGRQLFEVTKDGGVCVVVINDQTIKRAKTLTTFRWAIDWVDNAGWRLFETVIWRRAAVPGGWWSKRFMVDHEYVLIFFRGDDIACFDKSNLRIESKYGGEVRLPERSTYRGSGGQLKSFGKTIITAYKRCRGTVWDIANSGTERKRNSRKKEHPATYPDKLAADLILCFSREGETVLDPMIGSGTTAVQAAKLGRRYIGFDIAPEYIQLAKERLRTEVPTGTGGCHAGKG